MEREQRRDAIKSLAKRLSSRNTNTRLEGQNLTRHHAVLGLLYSMESRQLGETREQMPFNVTRSLGKGVFFAKKIVTWERQWLREGRIEDGRRGCFSKVRSWLNDEGVQMAVREYCAGAGDGISGYGLAKAVGDYLTSERATTAVLECFNDAAAEEGEPTAGEPPAGTKKKPRNTRIRARTARRWLIKEGYLFKSVMDKVI